MTPKISNALVLVSRPEQSQEEDLIRRVKDLFEVNAVTMLQVSNYYQMPEHAKHALCDALMDVTLCKVPARTGEGMWFFLGKEETL